VSQITRVPRGLQDFLGSQNFGSNPSQLGSVVAPTLDISPFMAADKIEYDIGPDSIGVNAPGTFVRNVEIQTGELVVLQQIGIMATLTSVPTPDDFISFTPGAENFPLATGGFNNPFVALSPTVTTPIPGNSPVNNVALMSRLAAPLIIQGGVTVRWLISSVVGTWDVRPFARLFVLQA
jgi:hypothetical protein